MAPAQRRRPGAAVGASQLQIALDLRTTADALRALQPTAHLIDVIEVGTVLCLSAGMDAVRCVRAAYPGHTVLADVRIAEAGSIIAGLAFEAGADWVSVVSGACLTTVEATVAQARRHGGDVQVELSEGWTWEYASACRERGVEQFVVHRSRDGEASGKLAWADQDLEAVRRLHQMGGRVSLTGGLSPAEISALREVPAEIFIAGRAIYGAADPAAAAADLRSAVDALPPVEARA